jgi:hypothetical protein
MQKKLERKESQSIDDFEVWVKAIIQLQDEKEFTKEAQKLTK